MESSQRAPQACRPCRRLKRKCTKEIPSCSLCIRLGKTCQYPARTRPTATGEIDGESPAELLPYLGERTGRTKRYAVASPPTTDAAYIVSRAQPRLQNAQTFPPAFFLDPDFLTPLSTTALACDGLALPEAKELVGGETHAICQQYFATTHIWLPFVSPKRVYQRTDSVSDSSLLILLLCMKLVSQPCRASCPSDSPLYQAARRLLAAMEDASVVSLCLLQALVMVAMYELGHGIFPAAFLTCGRAARLGLLMSLHSRNSSRSTQLLKLPGTWTEREEERRTWWAVLIVDRYLGLGPRGIPLCTSEPTASDLLPSEDDGWNAGEIGHNDPLYVAPSPIPRQSQLGSFAKTCQAGHMLGRVIRHRDEDSGGRLQRSSRLAGALQLHSALTALDTYLQAAEENVVGMAICCSAFLALSNLYGCNESDHDERVPEESDMQIAALESLKHIVMERVPIVARAVLLGGLATVDETSPLVVQCLYHAASECQWFIREGLYPEMETILQLTTDALKLLAERWTVAGTYLELLQSGPA